MAFVIDTSSSMADDMAQVKSYIRELILEQEKSGVQADYTVTTFADPCKFDTCSGRIQSDARNITKY